MGKLFKKTGKLNNKGVSLVELICSIAILSVIGVSIAGMMIISSNAYARGVTDVDSQQEAQFAANLIGNYVKDASEVVDEGGDLLIRMDDGSEYRVEYDDASGRMTFNGQLLAENVNDFSFDLSDFSASKYVEVSLTTGKNSRTFESRNTNTARNGEVSGNVAGDISATIIAPDALILEPCQEYVIPCSVLGVSNQNIVWTTSTPKAVVMGNTIKVDKNIDVNSFVIYGSTQALKKDMVTPAGTKSITVDVRKVTGFTFNGTLISGSALRNGAVYRIEMNMSGDNLPKNLTKETDYVSPYKIKWTDSYSGSGSASSTYQITERHDATESSPGYVLLKLKRDISWGGKIEVKGLVVHPEGKWPGESVYSNKSGARYAGSMSGTFTLMGVPYSYDGSKLYRGSDDPQLQFTAHDDIKNNLISHYGNGNYKSKMYYRCRPVTLSGDTVTWAGNWTDWRQNPGDADDSLAINLRPDATKQFGCNDAYEIQMVLTFWNDSTGHVYWPADYQTHGGESIQSIVSNVISRSTEDSAVYTIDDVMKPVTVSFNLKKGGSNVQSSVSSLGSSSAGYELTKNTEYSLNYAKAEGIKTDLIKNNLQYVVEQYVNGNWVEVMRYRNGENPFCFKLEANGKALRYESNYSGSVNVNKDSKRFRIKIRGIQVQGVRYNAGGNSYPTETKDYDFYDLSSGRGVFYITFK